MWRTGKRSARPATGTEGMSHDSITVSIHDLRSFVPVRSLSLARLAYSRPPHPLALCTACVVGLPRSLGDAPFGPWLADAHPPHLLGLRICLRYALHVSSASLGRSATRPSGLGSLTLARLAYSASGCFAGVALAKAGSAVHAASMRSSVGYGERSRWTRREFAS